jgi:hypothetical protein
MLSGSELVLVARVPRASDRWKQVHFNQRIAGEFFRLKIGEHKTARLERVDDSGYVVDWVKRPLVYSATNKNCKIEFDFPVKDYPTEGVPLLVVVELGLRWFRYRSVLPGDSGYEEMWGLTEELPTVGRGLPRVITTLDELEMRWPGSHIRSPRT